MFTKSSKMDWTKVPWPVMLVAGPLLGLVFVMALPFIGIALVLQTLGARLVKSLAPHARDLVAVATPAAPLGQAGLTSEGEEPHTEEKDLVKEVEERRNNGEQ